MTRTGRHFGRESIGAHALTAVLAESRRVGGLPRQRFVAYLGTIQVWENGWGQTAVGGGRGPGGKAFQVAIARFWADVFRRLDSVEEPHDREAIEAAIAAKVPRPVQSAPCGPR
ncbi:MAG: hypothetical protein ACYSTY_09860 [Planctomycetota bacterium]